MEFVEKQKNSSIKAERPSVQAAKPLKKPPVKTSEKATVLPVKHYASVKHHVDSAIELNNKDACLTTSMVYLAFDIDVEMLSSPGLYIDVPKVSN